MWALRFACSDRTSSARLGASATLALLAHAGVVLALPRLDASTIKEDALQLPPLVAVSFDALALGGAVGAGIEAPTAVPDSLPAISARARAAVRSSPRAPDDRDDPLRLDAVEITGASDNAVAELSEDASQTGDVSGDNGGQAASTGGNGNSGDGLGGSPSRGNGTHATGSGARLLGTRDPCAGYFPASSSAPRGRVSIAVNVDSSGFVTGSEVLTVNPNGAGFSQAAQACVSRLRFVPATTDEGHPTGSRTTLLLHFQRSE